MSNIAPSAHIPKPSPSTAHPNTERPRREAITAISGASARLMTIEVAINSAGAS